MRFRRRTTNELPGRSVPGDPSMPRRHHARHDSRPLGGDQLLCRCSPSIVFLIFGLVAGDEEIVVMLYCRIRSIGENARTRGNRLSSWLVDIFTSYSVLWRPDACGALVA